MYGRRMRRSRGSGVQGFASRRSNDKLMLQHCLVDIMKAKVRTVRKGLCLFDILLMLKVRTIHEGL